MRCSYQLLAGRSNNLQGPAPHEAQSVNAGKTTREAHHNLQLASPICTSKAGSFDSLSRYYLGRGRGNQSMRACHIQDREDAGTQN